MNTYPTESNKDTYMDVKDDPIYKTVTKYWKSIGKVTILEPQRKFNLSATAVLRFKYAYQYETIMEEQCKTT